MIDRVIAAFAQFEAELFAVFRMLQIAAEIAHLAVRRFVDADEVHLPRDPMPLDLKDEHGRNHHRRRHAGDVFSGHLANPFHVPLRIGKAFQAVALENHVREDAVDAALHLVREAGHHAVDHDHRGHAQRDADDRGQRDIARAQIPPAEQKFVHGQSFGCGM